MSELKPEDMGREILLRARIIYPGSRVSDIRFGDDAARGQTIKLHNSVLAIALTERPSPPMAEDLERLVAAIRRWARTDDEADPHPDSDLEIWLSIERRVRAEQLRQAANAIEALLGLAPLPLEEEAGKP